jgi:radical SAM superfamily enzyme YgiQ (UPF0313 family)
MKIGLLAIAGLRVCDDELLKLGLSFPGLRNRAETIEALPSLGLLTLASYIPKWHEVDYLEVREVVDEGALADFDVVFLSFLTATAREAYEIARKARELGVTVVLGGLHVTLNPAEAACHADSIVVGEGEPVMPRLMTDLESNCLQPVYRSRDFPSFDFSSARSPRFELLGPRHYSRFTVQTQRGCPLRCSFCAASIHLTPRFKTKPVAQVMMEIRLLKELYPSPFIEFADDNSFCDRRHSRELLRELAKEELSWFTESDVSIADDPELLALMKEAGCRQVLIGLEATTAKQLDGIEARSNFKAKRAEHYLRAIETIQSYGLSVNGCFVLGLETHDENCFEQVFDFVARSGLHDVQITYLTPFPGTELHRRLGEEGRLLAADAHERGTLFDINYSPQQMTGDTLREGFHSLMARLYHPQETRARHRRYLAMQRRQPL